jgi:hypothetical protein
MDILEDNRRAFALRSSQVIVLTAVLWGMTMGMVSALSVYLADLS